MGESEELVRKIAASFYRVMAETEPELARTHRQQDDGQIAPETQQRFALFLVEWLGGPARFSPVHGHPRLRRRHAHVPITLAMRDAWLRCMSAALDEHGINGEVRRFLDGRFAEVADFLRNRND